MKGYMIRNVYEPLYYRLIKNQVRFRYYDTYRSLQYKSLEDNKMLQADRLFGILKHAAENIPYYKRIARRQRIIVERDNVHECLRRFPILTKEILRKENDDLRILPESGWYRNSSGGSTGEPAIFYQDRDYWAHSDAMKRIFKEWAGYRIGDPFIKLWGSEKDIFRQKEHLKKRLLGWLYGIELLNSFMMSEEKMRQYVSAINRKKPRLIYAYAQSMNELSRFIESNRLRVHSPGAIITSANILTPEYRSSIERAFKCPVYNLYGSREVGDIACECEKHEGLHLNMYMHYVEILDKSLLPVKEGEMGDVYVTLLTNYTMPLIRYKVGDMAVYTEKECSCNRGLPLILEVSGRDNDMFITSKNEMVHTGIVNMQFYYKGFVRKYQVIQKRPDYILINLCLSEEAGRFDVDSELKNIEKNLKKIFGGSCRIEFWIVDDILPAKSGKYRYTIREF